MTELDDKLFLRQGTSPDGPFSLAVTPEQAGWAYSGLKVLTLAPGQSHTWNTDEDELLILPLSGSAVVTCEGVYTVGEKTMRALHDAQVVRGDDGAFRLAGRADEPLVIANVSAAFE